MEKKSISFWMEHFMTQILNFKTTDKSGVYYSEHFGENLKFDMSDCRSNTNAAMERIFETVTKKANI